MPTTSREELRASITRHNATFENLLRLIPPEFYFERESDPDQWRSRFQKHTKQEKQALKEAARAARRAKLDPANNKTIVDIQKEAASSSKHSSSKKGKEKAVMDVDDPASDSDAEARASQTGSDHDMDVDGPQQLFTPMKRESVADLKNKLHARIDELRQGRKSTSTPERSPRESLIDEQRREHTKRHAKQAQQTAKARNEAQLIVPHVRRRKNDFSSDSPTKKGPAGSDSGPTFASVQFSSLSSASKPSKHKTSSDPKTAIKQLASRADKIASLPEERRKVVEEKQKWEKAEARLDGEKVRDDIAKLKKVVKRKDKEKAKRTEKWSERKEAVAKDQAARIKKRNDNIASRHERKKNHASNPKKNKARPGFEGGKGFGGGGKSKKPMKK